MRIEIVTIGNELLLGFTVDRNAAWLAQALAELGVEVVRRATVRDDVDAIADAVRAALDRTGAVITTGGLGPTADDLTREAIADVFDAPLALDPALVQELERRWRERGRGDVLPPSNRRQAMVPRGARVLANPVGTAPGLWLEDRAGRWAAVLPGVPWEMRAIVEQELRPLLAARLGAAATVIRSRTLRTTGVPESVLAERLAGAEEALAGVSLAYLPGRTGVDLRVTVRDVPPDEADARLAAALGWLRERVGDAAYGEDGEDLAAVVLDACRAHGLRVAVAESCTGGLLGARLTAIPGSSDVVLGGVIAYANAVKVASLGVREETLAQWGAVSEAVALEMASGVRASLGADVGVGITGVAGPGGGTAAKPVGTVWIAADVQGRRAAEVARYPGDREEIRVRAAQAALALMLRLIR